MEIDDNTKGPEKLNISSRLEGEKLNDINRIDVKKSDELFKRKIEDDKKFYLDNKLNINENIENKNDDICSKNLVNSNERLKCEFPIKNVPEKLKTLNIEEIIVKTVERSIKQNDIDNDIKLNKSKELTKINVMTNSNSDETVKFDTIHNDKMNLSRSKCIKNDEFNEYTNLYKTNNVMTTNPSNDIISTNFLNQNDKIRSNDNLKLDKERNKIDYHQEYGLNAIGGNKSNQNNNQYHSISDEKQLNKFNNAYHDYKIKSPTILQANLTSSRSHNELDKIQSYNVISDVNNRIPKDLTKSKLNETNIYNPYSQNDGNNHLVKSYQEQHHHNSREISHNEKFRSSPSMNQYYNNSYSLATATNEANKYVQQRALNRSHQNNPYNYSNSNQYPTATSNLGNLPQSNSRLENQLERRNCVTQQQNISKESNHLYSNDNINSLHGGSINKNFNNFSSQNFYNESKCLDNKYSVENHPYSRQHYNDNIIKNENRQLEHMNMPQLIHNQTNKLMEHSVTQQLQMKPPDFSNMNATTSQLNENSNKTRPLKYSPYEITPKNFSEISKKLNYIEDLQLKNPEQHIPMQGSSNFEQQQQRSDSSILANNSQQQISEQYPRRIVVKKHFDDNLSLQNVNNVTTYSQYDYKYKYEMSDTHHHHHHHHHHHQSGEINRNNELIKYPTKLNENKPILINEKIKVYHERNYANASASGYENETKIKSIWQDSYGVSGSECSSENLTKDVVRDVVVKTESSMYSKNYIQQQNPPNAYKCVAPINFNSHQIDTKSYGSNNMHSSDHQITTNIMDGRPSPTTPHQWPILQKSATIKQDDIYLNTQRNINSMEHHNSQYITSSSLQKSSSYDIKSAKHYPTGYYPVDSKLNNNPNQLNSKMQYNNMLPPLPTNINYNTKPAKKIIASDAKNSKPNYRELINNYHAMRQATSEDELNMKIIQRALKINPTNVKSNSDSNKNQNKSNSTMPIATTSRDLTNSYPKTYAAVNPGYEKIMLPEKPKEKLNKMYMESQQRAQHHNDINVTISKINNANECCINTNAEANISNAMHNKMVYPVNERLQPPADTYKRKVCLNNIPAMKSNAYSPLDLSVKTIKTKADSTGCAEYKSTNSRYTLGVESSIISVPKINFLPNFASATIKVDPINENLDRRNHEYLQPMNATSSNLSNLDPTHRISPGISSRTNNLMQSNSSSALNGPQSSFNQKYANSFDRSVENKYHSSYESNNKINLKTGCQFVNVIKNVQPNERERNLENSFHQQSNEFYLQHQKNTVQHNKAAAHPKYSRHSNDVRIPMNHHQLKLPSSDQYSNQMNYSHYPSNYRDVQHYPDNNNLKIKIATEEPKIKPMDLNVKPNVDPVENKRDFSVIQNISKANPVNIENVGIAKISKKNYSSNDFLESQKQSMNNENISSHDEPVSLEKSSPQKSAVQSNCRESIPQLIPKSSDSTDCSNGAPQQKRCQPIKPDIASLIAARIRTKGELKVFVPTPSNGNKVTSKYVENYLEVNPVPPQKSTEKSDSVLNLNDWSFACNDFVEQLKSGTVNKKRTKKERKIVIQNPNENVQLHNFPGKEYSGDVDKKLIEELRTAKLHGSNSTSDDEPLNLLKQKATPSQPIIFTIELGGNMSTATETKKENDRNIRRREKQRRYEEKRLAARLSQGHSTSSDSDSGDNHLRNKRSRKIPRKPRSKIDQNSNSDLSSGSENESINEKWKFSENQDNLDVRAHNLNESFKKNKIVQKEYMTKAEMKYMSPSKEICQENELAIVKIEPIQEDTVLSKSSEENQDLKGAGIKIKSNEKLKRSIENIEKEETMTRSRKRKQLEIQIANSKVLRNKIIRNTQFEKYSRTKQSNLIAAQKKNNLSNEKLSKDNINPPSKSSNSQKFLPQRLRSRTNFKINEKNKKASKNLLKLRLNNKNKLKILQQNKKNKLLSSKFPPGWEHEVYEYKKKLKIPLSLIRIKGHAETNKKASKSLPDLDSHSSDFSEISDRNNKTSKTNIKIEPSIDVSELIKKSDTLKKPNFEPSVNKHASIIDLLHSRVIKKQQTFKKNKSFPTGNVSTAKSTVIKKTETELLSSIVSLSNHKNDTKLDSNEKQHHNVFETKVLKSRTRTESKVLKNKELIREIFGGDDRPASAPPDYKNVLFADKYEEFLAKMNPDFGEKANVKQEKFNDQIFKIELNADDKPINDESNESAPIILAKTKKINKYRNFRRKGSSGFDYIRKKKKVQPISSNMNSQDSIKKRKKLQYFEVTQPRDENDVSKEIQKWVLNKSVGQSALHKAARLGYLDVIAYCLERMGMNPDAKDNAGYTPLHEACSKGRIDIARVLLEYGANHSEAAHSGIRPLHEAVENGYIEIVRLLLSYGADPLLTTYSGQTPLMLAEDSEMEQFIKNHLLDVQSMEAKKHPWKFPGPWKIFDPDDSGFDLLSDAPQDDNLNLSKNKLVKYKNLDKFPTNIDTKNKHEKLKLKCYVTLCKNITYDDNHKETILNESDNLTDDNDKFMFEESDAPLPPLYLLRDEGLEQWVLLNDLCNLLKVKSKETLLKQIYPSSQPASVNKELLRELKVTEFLEKAVCLQLICSGEKLNMGSSKVILVKYNERVKDLLGVKAVTI